MHSMHNEPHRLRAMKAATEALIVVPPVPDLSKLSTDDARTTMVQYVKSHGWVVDFDRVTRGVPSWVPAEQRDNYIDSLSVKMCEGCDTLMVERYNYGECKHSRCGVCHRAWQAAQAGGTNIYKNTCLLCKTGAPVACSGAVQNALAIAKTTVCCTYNERGCDKYYTLGKEYENEIEHMVVCDYADSWCDVCKTSMQRRERKIHVCPNRLEQCAQCSEWIQHHAMENHISSSSPRLPCHGFILCPRGCSDFSTVRTMTAALDAPVTVIRANRALEHKKTCLAELNPCAICCIPVLNSLIEQHNSSHATQHAALKEKYVTLPARCRIAQRINSRTTSWISQTELRMEVNNGLADFDMSEHECLIEEGLSLRMKVRKELHEYVLDIKLGVADGKSASSKRVRVCLNVCTIEGGDIKKNMTHEFVADHSKRNHTVTIQLWRTAAPDIACSVMLLSEVDQVKAQREKRERFAIERRMERRNIHVYEQAAMQQERRTSVVRANSAAAPMIIE